MIVWRDGDLIDGDNAVSAADRGFLVGDGIFETLWAHDGVAAFIPAHLARLKVGAACLGIKLNLDTESVGKAVQRLAQDLAIRGPAACRITVTRSGGARGLTPPPDARTRIVISLAQMTPVRPELAVTVSSVTRFSGAPTNHFKCAGAYAPNLLARLEATRAGAEEAIMLNEFGQVACASAANIFLIAEGRILTPSETEGALPGIVRAILLEEAAALGIDVKVGRVAPELLLASTILLTNSLIGVARGRLNDVPQADNPHPDNPCAEDRGLELQLAAAYQKRVQDELSGRNWGTGR